MIEQIILICAVVLAFLCGMAYEAVNLGDGKTGEK